MSRKKTTLLSLLVAGALAAWGLLPSATVQARPPVDQSVLTGSLPSSFADVIQGVSPAVVNISITAPANAGGEGPLPVPPDSPFGQDFEDFMRRFFNRQSYSSPEAEVRGMGSGFLIDPDGYVVTNNHVVGNASSIVVTLNDGTQHEAHLIGTDEKTDLALVKIDTDGPLPYARFGDSDRARAGDWVIAIGNPFGLGGTATTGIISARGRDIQSGPFDDFLQIDAPINSGNSGGPLFDLGGRVIGINTAIFTPNGGNVGIGFAIPAAQAEPIIDQLRSSGHVTRGYLGVTIQGMDQAIARGLGLENTKGALVASVVPDSPAARAGLVPGDVIVGIDGQTVDHVKDLTRAVAAVAPGQTTHLDVLRNGERRSLAVVVGESPSESARAEKPSKRSTGHLGLALSELTPQARQRFQVPEDVRGALVVEVEPGSVAEQHGIRPGDVIATVGQTKVSSPSEAKAAIEAARAKGGESLLLRLLRGGSARFVALPLS
jgi:serine protease Do